MDSARETRVEVSDQSSKKIAIFFARMESSFWELLDIRSPKIA